MSKGNSGDGCARWYVSKTLSNFQSNGMPMLGDVLLKYWLDSCVEGFLASFFYTCFPYLGSFFEICASTNIVEEIVNNYSRN